uniref:Expressed protein n=2 Tax=Oryza TaxID=4527 RepID=Q10BF9_ORYSJ|nr:expressed protein [Oryza sativa Japonica Group]
MAAVSEVEVDGVVFPPVARPPGSGHAHFLAGAGLFVFALCVPCQWRSGNAVQANLLAGLIDPSCRCEGSGDRRQLHQVHGHRRVPGGGRGRAGAGQEVGRQVRRRARRRRRLLPRRRHRRFREVHEGDDDPAAHRRAVLGQGDGELRRGVEGRRRVHGRRGRGRGQVQGGLQAPQLPSGRVHPLHPLPARRPHRRVLQGLVGARGRRGGGGDREQGALRGGAGFHHRRARGLAGGEAEHSGPRLAAPEGGIHRRRGGGGARAGVRVKIELRINRASKSSSYTSCTLLLPSCLTMK